MEAFPCQLDFQLLLLIIGNYKIIIFPVELKGRHKFVKNGQKLKMREIDCKELEKNGGIAYFPYDAEKIYFRVMYGSAGNDFSRAFGEKIPFVLRQSIEADKRAFIRSLIG